MSAIFEHFIHIMFAARFEIVKDRPGLACCRPKRIMNPFTVSANELYFQLYFLQFYNFFLARGVNHVGKTRSKKNCINLGTLFCITRDWSLEKLGWKFKIRIRKSWKKTDRYVIWLLLNLMLFQWIIEIELEDCMILVLVEWKNILNIKEIDVKASN